MTNCKSSFFFGAVGGFIVAITFSGIMLKDSVRDEEFPSYSDQCKKMVVKRY